MRESVPLKSSVPRSKYYRFHSRTATVLFNSDFHYFSKRIKGSLVNSEL